MGAWPKPEPAVLEMGQEFKRLRREAPAWWLRVDAQTRRVLAVARLGPRASAAEVVAEVERLRRGGAARP